MKFSIKTGEALELLKQAIGQQFGGANVKFVKFCDSKGELIRISYVEVVIEKQALTITQGTGDATIKVDRIISTHASDDDVNLKLKELEERNRKILEAMRFDSCTRCLEGVLNVYEHDGILQNEVIQHLQPKFNMKAIKQALYYTITTKQSVLRRYNSANQPYLLLNKFW